MKIVLSCLSSFFPLLLFTCQAHPLSRACRDGNLRVVQALLADTSTDVNWHPEPKQSEYRPALIEAIIGGHLDVFNMLLSSGAKPDLEFDDDPSKEGWRPVSYIAEAGNMGMFVALTRHGFDPDFSWSFANSPNFQHTISVWSTPMAMLPECFAGLVAMEVRRIRNGVIPVDYRSAIDSYRLLDRVVMFGTLDQIRLVYSLGADLNSGFTQIKVNNAKIRSTQSTAIQPPIVTLCKYQLLFSAEKVVLLKELGADINACIESCTTVELQKYGRTALWYACSYLGPEEISLLLSHGASPYIRDSQGNNLISVCLNTRNISCAIEILKALHKLSEKTIESALMETNKFGISPLDIAINTNNHYAVRLFLLLGAKISKEPSQYNSMSMASLTHILAKEFTRLRVNVVKMLLWTSELGQYYSLPKELCLHILRFTIEMSLQLLD